MAAKHFLSPILLIALLGLCFSAAQQVHADVEFPRYLNGPGPDTLQAYLQGPGDVFNANDLNRFVDSRKTTFDDWADALEKTEPKTPKEIWTAWYVFCRANRVEPARKLCPLWKELVEAMSDNRLWRRQRAVSVLFGEHLNVFDREKFKIPWGIWLAAYETFRDFYYPRYTPFYLKNEGWDNDKIIKWTKEQIQVAQKSGINPKLILQYRTPFFRYCLDGELVNENACIAVNWMGDYLVFLHRRQDDNIRQYETDQWLKKPNLVEPKKPLDEEIKRLNEDARNHPGDWQRMSFLLCALGRISQRKDSARYDMELKNSPDLDWIIDTASEYTIAECLWLGRAFQGFSRPDIAEPFFRAILKKPLSDEYLSYVYPKEMRIMHRPGMPFYEISDDHVRAMFRVMLIDQTIYFFKSLHEQSKEQNKDREKDMAAWQEERTELAEKYHVGYEDRSRPAPWYYIRFPAEKHD